MKRILTLLLVISLTGCQEEPAELTGINLSDEQLSIDFADSLYLQAIPVPADATIGYVDWISSDESIVTVDAEGMIKARRVGSAKVTVQDGNYSASSDVTVLATNTTFQEPLADASARKDAIIAHESRTLNYEELQLMIYAGENEHITGVVYQLETGYLKGAIVVINDNEESIALVLEHMAQRYGFIPNDGAYLIFDRGDSVAGFTYDLSFGWVLVYLPGSPSGRLDFAEIFREIQNQMYHN